MDGRPPRRIDWLRVAVWTAAAVICAGSWGLIFHVIADLLAE